MRNPRPMTAAAAITYMARIATMRVNPGYFSRHGCNLTTRSTNGWSNSARMIAIAKGNNAPRANQSTVTTTSNIATTIPARRQRCQVV